MSNDVAWAGPLRAALEQAEFSYDAVVDLLGSHAHAALSRNETLPGLRATQGGSPRDTLTRLFLLQTSVPIAAAERALPGLVDRLCVAGVLEQSVAEVRARLDCRPYAADDHDLWLISDLTPGLDGAQTLVGPDHVLGVSSAATSLAQLTVREPVARALDLGTGCGIQALHLAAHAQQVVATDVNPRALWLTRVNAALNGVPDGSVETRAGSFYEAVRGERFDLVTTNPPFVISPATAQPLVYRDSGMPGDQVVEHVVRRLPGVLAEGGTGQVLANWAIRRDQPWDERLAGWLDDSCDSWVVQREVLDLPAYVELWLKDAGQHPSTGRTDVAEYHRRYDTWVSWLEREGIEAVGFGWISLRAGGAGAHRLEEWPYAVEQPIGPEVEALLDRVARLRASDDTALLASRPVTRVDVRQESLGAPGAEDPEEIVLRQQRLLRRARRADTVEAALVGALDGDLTVAQVLDALAHLLDRDPGDLRATYLPVVRDLVAEGFLQL